MSEAYVIRQTCSSGSSGSSPSARSQTRLLVARMDGSRSASKVSGPMWRMSIGLARKKSCACGPNSFSIRSAVGVTDSGGGTAGIAMACDSPGSGWWNDAESVKIVFPCCTPVTRRVVNDRPSRTRSTR